METDKILQSHDRQLRLLPLLNQVGFDSLLGKAIRWFSYYTDLPIWLSQWRAFITVRKKQIGDKFLGLDQGLMRTTYPEVRALLENPSQTRGPYIGPFRIAAPSYFLKNTLSLGTNGAEHIGVRAVITAALPDPSQVAEDLALLVEQFLDRAVVQGSIHIGKDLPKLFAPLLHRIALNMTLSEPDIIASAAYSGTLGFVTLPDIAYNTILRNKTQPHTQHRQHLITAYRDSPNYPKLLALGKTHGLSEHQITNTLFDTIHVAGIAGASALLGSVVGVICQNAAVRAEVLAECDRLWSSGQTPNAQTLAQMVFTEKVILEAARLYPPVRWVSQLATEDQEVQIGTQKCPFKKGTRLMGSIFGANYDPNQYPSPDTFDPHRDFSHLLSWNGEGHERMCPGRSLSIAVIKLFCLYALKQYQWDMSNLVIEWDMQKFAPFTPDKLELRQFSRQ